MSESPVYVRVGGLRDVRHVRAETERLQRLLGHRAHVRGSTRKLSPLGDQCTLVRAPAALVVTGVRTGETFLVGADRNVLRAAAPVNVRDQTMRAIRSATTPAGGLHHPGLAVLAARVGGRGGRSALSVWRPSSPFST